MFYFLEAMHAGAVHILTGREVCCFEHFFAPVLQRKSRTLIGAKLGRSENHFVAPPQTITMMSH